MILTEDHAAIYAEMLSGWKTATQIDNPSVMFECYQWQSPITTRNGKHYVRTLSGEPYRTYGKCSTFAVGDYICRGIAHPNEVWVVSKTLFDGKYKII